MVQGQIKAPMKYWIKIHHYLAILPRSQSVMIRTAFSSECKPLNLESGPSNPHLLSSSLPNRLIKVGVACSTVTDRRAFANREGILFTLSGTVSRDDPEDSDTKICRGTETNRILLFLYKNLGENS